MIHCFTISFTSLVSMVLVVELFVVFTEYQEQKKAQHNWLFMSSYENSNVSSSGGMQSSEENLTTVSQHSMASEESMEPALPGQQRRSFAFYDDYDVANFCRLAYDEENHIIVTSLVPDNSKIIPPLYCFDPNTEQQSQFRSVFPDAPQNQ